MFSPKLFAQLPPALVGRGFSAVSCLSVFAVRTPFKVQGAAQILSGLLGIRDGFSSCSASTTATNSQN